MKKTAFLAIVAAFGIAGAYAAHAVPLAKLASGEANPLFLLTGHHEHDHNGRMNGDSANGCMNSGDDEDYDEDGGNCGNGNGQMMQQNMAPPSNGLFTPGSKPQVQAQ